MTAIRGIMAFALSGTVLCMNAAGHYESRPADCYTLGGMEICHIPPDCHSPPDETLTPDNRIYPGGLIKKEAPKEVGS